MKKIVLRIIFIAVLLLGICELKSYAGTLNTESEGANTVKVSLSVDNGIVRAISMSLKITGDVSVETLQWSSEMSDYLKRYTYNPTTKVLSIYITPGTGISMNKNDVMTIGNIQIKGNSDTDYRIKLETAQIIGGDYQNINENISHTEKNFRYTKNVITSNTYELKDNYVTKISKNTSVADFKKNIQAPGTVVVKDKDGKTVNDDEKVKTGMKIAVGATEYELVVPGDIDGNGDITLNDLAKACLHVIEKEILNGAYKEAANVDYSGNVTLNDLAVLQLILIGKN